MIAGFVAHKLLEQECYDLPGPAFAGKTRFLGSPRRRLQKRLLTKAILYPTAFACSRNLNFWILPVEVFGNSLNTM